MQGLASGGAAGQSERALAQERATEECPQIGEAFLAVQAAPVEERPAMLRETIPGAWLECECQADIEFVSADLVWTPENATAVVVEERSVEELLQKVGAGDGTRWSSLW